MFPVVKVVNPNPVVWSVAGGISDFPCAATKFRTPLPLRGGVSHLPLATCHTVRHLASVCQNVLVANPCTPTSEQVARVFYGNDTLRPQASETQLNPQIFHAASTGLLTDTLPSDALFLHRELIYSHGFLTVSNQSMPLLQSVF